MWSAKSSLWSVNCKVQSLEDRVSSVERKVECTVWSDIQSFTQHVVRSVQCQV